MGRCPRAGLKRGAAATVDALHLEPVGETHKKITHGLVCVCGIIPPTLDFVYDVCQVYVHGDCSLSKLNPQKNKIDMLLLDAIHRGQAPCPTVATEKVKGYIAYFPKKQTQVY